MSTAPTAPTLTLSNATGDAHYPGSGSTIWFRSAAGAGGSFDVTASSTDAQTGVASYSFPALGAGWSQSGSGATRTYTYAERGGDTGCEQRHGNQCRRERIRQRHLHRLQRHDRVRQVARSPRTAAAPTTVTAPSRSLRSTSLTAAPASPVTRLTRESATLAADACGSFSGSDPVTITAGNDADTLTTGCYRYTLTGTDNVGNQSSVQSAIVKVDTSPPTAPTLAVSNLSANAHYAAGTLFIQPVGGRNVPRHRDLD